MWYSVDLGTSVQLNKWDSRYDQPSYKQWLNMEVLYLWSVCHPEGILFFKQGYIVPDELSIICCLEVNVHHLYKKRWLTPVGIVDSSSIENTAKTLHHTQKIKEHVLGCVMLEYNRIMIWIQYITIIHSIWIINS